MRLLRSIRARLTAWYALVLAIVLAAAGTASYGLLQRELRHSTDASLRAVARQVTAELEDEAKENSGALPAEMVKELLRDHDRAIVVFTNDGRELASFGTPDAGELRRRLEHRAFGFVTLPGMRLLLVPVRVAGAAYVLAIGQPLAAQEDLLTDLRQAMLLTIPLVLLIATAGGYLLARKSLAPVAAMAGEARAITAASLGDRIAVTNPDDELGQLAATLNDLLHRLEESFESQRRFMAEASHELRTPVAILQGEIDVTLSRDDRDARDYRESVEIMRKSVQRLTRIVRDLFLLARGDTGQVPMNRERFYLDEVAAQTVHAFRTLAAERKVTIREEHATDLLMRGDEDLIQRLLGNLIENAIRHTPAGGEIVVRSERRDGELRVEVHDRGRGIPPELHERIFERFFRIGGGTGLGLPIARWIAEAHGGRVWLERSGEDGSVFAAVLPAAGGE